MVSRIQLNPLRWTPVGWATLAYVFIVGTAFVLFAGEDGFWPLFLVALGLREGVRWWWSRRQTGMSVHRTP